MTTPPLAFVRLLGPVQVRELAEELDVTPTKKLGQNFVHDAGTVRKITTLAEVSPGEQVLEIGPGLGSLTLALLEAGATVTAVEIDRRLATRLPQTAQEFAGEIGASRLSVVHADALEVPATLVGQPQALVANLPYNVSVPVLFRALALFPSLKKVVVMVQKEVADRLAAAAGSRVYGAPSVKLAWYGKARYAGTIGPNVFWPKPNVDSALVEVSVNPVSEDTSLRDTTFELVDAAFSQRRKMLRTSLKPLLGDYTAAIFEEAGVDPAARPEQLGIEEFVALAKTLGKAATKEGQTQ